MSAYPFVKFDLLPKLEVGHLSGDLLLVSEVREGVEMQGQVINGDGCRSWHNSVACPSGNLSQKNPTHFITYIVIRDIIYKCLYFTV